MKRRPHLLTALGLLVLGCGPGQPILEVTVAGALPAGTQTLQLNATLTRPGAPAVSALRPQTIAGRLDSFLVRLPADAAGTVSLSVSAVDGGACQIMTNKAGSAQVAVSGPGRYPITVTLDTPVLGCSLTVVRAGDGNGQVLVSREGAPLQPTCSTCSVYRYAFGDTITLTAADTNGDYFGGWSLASCGLTGTCAVKIGSGATTVSASFFPRRVCTNSKTSDGFCWEGPLPQGNAINRVYSFSSQDVWAVGDLGVILHWNGDYWVPFKSGTSNNLNAVWEDASNDVWIAGDRGTLLHYSGSVFSNYSSKVSGLDSHPSLRGVAGDGQGGLLLAGSGGTLARATITRDAHGSITAIAARPLPCTPALSADLNALRATAGGGGGFVAAGAAGTVLAGTPAGCTWQHAVPGITFHGVFGDAGSAWAAGDNGTGGVLVQAGAAGVTTSMTLPTLLRGVWGSSDGTLWLVGDAGAVLRGAPAQGGGLSFTPVDNSIELRGLRDISGTGPDDLWAVGQGGALLHGNVAFFVSTDTGSSTPIHGVYQDAPGRAWLVGEVGTILRFAGSALSALQAPAAVSLYGVSGAGSGAVWAVGDAGTILHYDGTGWTAQHSGTSARLHGVWAGTPAAVWAVGDGGVILHFDGSSWTSQPSGTTQALAAVWGSGTTDVWSVGAAGTVLRYDGSKWAAVTGLAQGTGALAGVWGCAADDVLVAGAGGTVQHYNGSTWTSEKSSTTQALAALWGDPGSCASGAVAWAAGAGGVVVKRVRGTWAALPQVATADLLGIGGVSPDEFWIAGQLGVALRHVPATGGP